jgi:triosephosphate isomerase
LSHPIFAANWKMNLGPPAARAFLRTFLPHYPRHYDRTVIFFPPAVSVTAVVEEIDGRPDIMVGVQNIHWEDQGAFTGELSAPMAREAGARLTLVGHSERRHVFGDTNEDCSRKCKAAQRAGLTPVLCVGETLSERENGETERVVLRQLRIGLSLLEKPEPSDLMIAYEPVWAIGTGRNATPEDASAIHTVIRAELRHKTAERASAIPILYGGSVNAGNVALLLAAADIDGVLVGGSSLNAGTWSSIVQTTAEIREEYPEITLTE